MILTEARKRVRETNGEGGETQSVEKAQNHLKHIRPGENRKEREVNAEETKIQKANIHLSKKSQITVKATT
jgi:hypothetical protein